MKNELLNAFMHISINGTPLHSKEAAILIIRKVPKLFSESSNATNASTQTEVIVDVELSYENVI